MGIEQIDKRGKELISSQKIIESLLTSLKDYIDIIVGDALYFNQTDFSIALKYNKHLFVKSRETSLDIIKETEQEYKMELLIPNSDKNRFIKSDDMERGCSFTVFKKTPYFYKDIPQPLSCYRIEENYFKTQQKEIFYCITTAQNISLIEAREIAKKRWQIENNVFRLGNQSFYTKRKRFKNDTTNKNYLILIYLFLSILWFLYQISIELKLIKPEFANFKFFCIYHFRSICFNPAENRINTS